MPYAEPKRPVWGGLSPPTSARCWHRQGRSRYSTLQHRGIDRLRPDRIGKPEANPVTFELLPLLPEIINIARTLAHEKQLRFSLHVDARCPLRLHGERRYLREILQNLVSNAIKFTQQGGVMIAVRPFEFTRDLSHRMRGCRLGSASRRGA